jgi:hypothetical protein
MTAQPDARAAAAANAAARNDFLAIITPFPWLVPLCAACSCDQALLERLHLSQQGTVTPEFMNAATIFTRTEAGFSPTLDN